MAEQIETRYAELQQAQKGAKLSIMAYIILAILKVGIGLWAGSEALYADGINNSTDIMASVAVLIGLRIARKPIDEDHQYGHFRAETIASLVAALIMIAVGCNVLIDAITAVVAGKVEAPNMLAATTGIFCSAVIYLVYLYNRRLAKRIHSPALMAAAKDNLSDVWVGLGTVFGIMAAQLNLPWLDPLAAVVVAILIIKTGWDIFKESSHNLTDGFDKEQLDLIAESVALVPHIQEVKQIRARAHGNAVLLDIVVAVDPYMTVMESHKVADAVEAKLANEFDIYEAIIHVEPAFLC